MSDLLKGKRGLVMGVANERSIAWGIAKAMHDAGAELAFTYQGEAFGKRLEPLAQSVGSDFMVDVDVTDDASLDAAFAQLAARWPTIDFLIHAIAFSDKSELTGRFLNTSRANFKHSLDISAYSFIEVARRAHPLMVEKGGTLLTLTYQGSNRVVPGKPMISTACFLSRISATCWTCCSVSVERRSGRTAAPRAQAPTVCSRAARTPSALTSP